MTAHRYATTLRPAGGGGLPSRLNGHWSYVEAPQDGRLYWGKDGWALIPSHYRYGVIETDLELTAEELTHFDIVEVKR